MIKFELLRSRHSLQTHIRAIRTALSIQTIDYQLADVLLRGSIKSFRNFRKRIFSTFFQSEKHFQMKTPSLCHKLAAKRLAFCWRFSRMQSNCHLNQPTFAPTHSPSRPINMESCTRMVSRSLAFHKYIV